MAVLKNSPLEGMRGTLGDLVFRTWNGKTYVYAKTTKPLKQSDAQKKHRERFRNASQRAKQLLEDENLLAYYQNEAFLHNLPNAYTVALREMMMTLS